MPYQPLDDPEYTGEPHDKPALQLTGTDGNAFAILGRASKVLRQVGRGDEVAEYQRQATTGDYDHLLAVTMDWFDVS